MKPTRYNSMWNIVMKESSDGDYELHTEAEQSRAEAYENGKKDQAITQGKVYFNRRADPIPDKECDCNIVVGDSVWCNLGLKFGDLPWRVGTVIRIDGDIYTVCTIQGTHDVDRRNIVCNPPILEG